MGTRHSQKDKKKKKKETLETLSTPAFSWRATVIFKTGTFAQSCSLVLSLGLYFTDTVILETAFAPSLSIAPPFSLSLLSSTHSSLALSCSLFLLIPLLQAGHETR